MSDLSDGWNGGVVEVRNSNHFLWLIMSHDNHSELVSHYVVPSPMQGVTITLCKTTGFIVSPFFPGHGLACLAFTFSLQGIEFGVGWEGTEEQKA